MKRLILLLSIAASAQTRLYLPFNGSSPVNPPVGAGWSDSSAMVRHKLADVKGSSAIAAGQTVTILEDQASYDDLDRQYTSTRMDAGIIFALATTSITSVVMMREFATTDNVDKCIMNVRVVSEDGQTDRAVLFSTENYGPVLEFVNNATMRNKQCASGGDLVLAAYTTVLGDRLVVEYGYMTTGAETTPEAAGKWGENASDCAENETNTTDCAGWIQFSNTITFAGEIATAQGVVRGRIK